MEKQLSKDFHPSNDKAKGFENLTAEEIQSLGKQFPNEPSQDAYLVLKDTNKPDKAQLFPLSTWANLAELHRLGQTNFVPAGFKNGFNRAKAGTVPTAPVQDLTKEEAKNAPGLRKTQSNGQDESANNSGNASTEGSGDVNDDIQVPADKLELPELKERFEQVTGKKAGRTSKENLLKAIKKAEKNK